MPNTDNLLFNLTNHGLSYYSFGCKKSMLPQSDLKFVQLIDSLFVIQPDYHPGGFPYLIMRG